MTNELKKALAIVDAKKVISDSYNDMDGDEYEDEEDKAYADYWEAARAAAGIIVKMTSGQVDENTALRMIFHKREQLNTLIKRAA